MSWGQKLSVTCYRGTPIQTSETLQSELQELDDKICNGGFFDQGLFDSYEV